VSLILYFFITQLIDYRLQEGMVFVSMSSEHLLARTSHYQIRDTCPHAVLQSSERRGPVLAHEEGPPMRRSWANFRREIASNFIRQSDFSSYSHAQNADSPDTDSTPPPDDAYPFGYTMSPSDLHQIVRPSSPEYQITTNCEDPSGDEEEPSSHETLTDLSHRQLHNYEESSTSEEEDPQRTYRYRRQRSFPRRIEWIDKESITDIKPTDPLRPHAKFFIERKRHVVSIKFDPPVSAKYILLKLWSPQGKDNIDIQCVSVHGFAGPRFFPSVSVR
jgi:hypothetical protein